MSVLVGGGGAEEGRAPNSGSPPLKRKSPGDNRDALLYNPNPITLVTALSRPKLVRHSCLIPTDHFGKYLADGSRKAGAASEVLLVLNFPIPKSAVGAPEVSPARKGWES